MWMLSNMSSNYDNQPSKVSQPSPPTVLYAGLCSEDVVCTVQLIFQNVIVFVRFGSVFFHLSSSNLKFFQV